MPELPVIPVTPVNDVEKAVITRSKSEKPMAQLVHEQEMERLKTAAKLRRELWLTTFALFFLSAISLTCVWVILRGGYPEGTQKLAETVLTALVSGLLGYLAGKQSGKEEK